MLDDNIKQQIIDGISLRYSTLINECIKTLCIDASFNLCIYKKNYDFKNEDLYTYESVVSDIGEYIICVFKTYKIDESSNVDIYIRKIIDKIVEQCKRYIELDIPGYILYLKYHEKRKSALIELLNKNLLGYIEYCKDTSNYVRDYNTYINNIYIEYFTYLISGKGSSNIINDLNEISKTPYESKYSKGRLAILKKYEDIENHINNNKNHIEFINEIPLSDYKASRKIIEMSNENWIAISDCEYIYGIVKENDDLKALATIIEFKGYYSYNIELNNKNIVFKYANLVHEKVDNENTTDNKNITYKAKNALKSLYKDEINEEQKTYLINRINEIKKQKNGAMLVISKKAREEADRLKGQSTCIYSQILTDSLIESISSIDGSIIVDKDCKCYAIGVILDGVDCKIGNKSRGARYNSAIKYVNQRSNECIVIVISEDGMIDIIDEEEIKSLKEKLEEENNGIIKNKMVSNVIIEIERKLGEINNTQKEKIVKLIRETNKVEKLFDIIVVKNGKLKNIKDIKTIENLEIGVLKGEKILKKKSDVNNYIVNNIKQKHCKYIPIKILSGNVIKVFNQDNLYNINGKISSDLVDTYVEVITESNIQNDVYDNLYLAMIYYMLGMYKNAIKYIEQDELEILEISNLYDLIGCIYNKNSQFEKAIEYLEKAVKIEPQNADYNNNLGYAYFENKQLDKAIEYLEKAVKIKLENAQYNNNLGYAYFENKQLDKAIEYLEKAVKIEPQNAQYNNNLGRVYLENKQLDKAIEYLEKAVKIELKNAQYNNNLGLAYLESKQLDKAIEYLEKAVKIEPQNADYNNNLGRVYLENKQLDKAIEYLEKAVKIDQENAQYNNNLGHAYFENKQLDKAIKYLEKAVKIKPKNAQYNNNLGHAYFENKQLDKAIKYLEKAVKIETENAQYNNNLGYVYLENKQLNKAIEYLEKAVKIEPENAQYNNNLGYAYLENKQLDKSIEYLDRVVKIEPKNAQYNNNLGYVYLENKQLDKAIEYLEKAVKIEPENEEYNYYLGLAYLKKKHLDKSVKILSI